MVLAAPYLISCVLSSNYSDKRCRLFIKSDCLPRSTKKNSERHTNITQGHHSLQ